LEEQTLFLALVDFLLLYLCHYGPPLSSDNRLVALLFFFQYLIMENSGLASEKADDLPVPLQKKWTAAAILYVHFQPEEVRHGITFRPAISND